MRSPETEEEVIIGDKLADRLGLVLEEAGRGMRRFRWESPKKLKKSKALALVLESIGWLTPIRAACSPNHLRDPAIQFP